MWKTPSIGGAAIVTVPTCQKPFMPRWLFTVVFVFMAGVCGAAIIWPSHDQLPSKGLSWAISGAGLGAGMPAAAGAAEAFVIGLGAGLALAWADVEGAAARQAAASATVRERAVIVISFWKR